MTTTHYVQLPPDGVGKKVRHRLITDLRIDRTGYANVTPSVNDTVKGASSTATGILTGIYSAEDTTYYLKDVTGVFTAGEYITNSTGTITYGNVLTITSNVNVSSTVISDPRTPEYTMSVIRSGAGLVSFPESSPQFDSFGHMQIAQMVAVGEYYHFVQDLSGKYYTQQTGGGTVVYNPLQSSMTYTTGTASGDVARRTTNQYHPYKPGVGQLVLTSIQLGELRSGVTRMWGYFDDRNGYGFRVDGTTVSVFLRNDITGYVVDYIVNQQDWNVNKLNVDATSDLFGDIGDYTSAGPKALDVTNSNLYWMDMQGTVGRVRLGVITPDGRRILCHQFQWPNSFPSATTSSQTFFANGTPYTSTISWGSVCRNLSLPMTWQQYNTTSTGGSSTMRVGAGVVFTESADLLYGGVLTHITPANPIVVKSNETYQPFLQFKAKSTVPGPTVSPSSFVKNVSYTIESVGSTNFTAVGAPSNTVGVTFVATGAGSGTGTAHMNVQNTIIGIHETFDWVSTGNVSLSVGIFVVPSEEYVTGLQWSDTIQPQTMLYVDQSATEFSQYQLWGTAANVNGYISPGLTADYEGNASTQTGNLKVTAVNGTSGNLYKEMYLVDSTNTITSRTRVIKQLYADGAGTVNVAIASGGAIGSRFMTMASNVALAVGQIVSGTGVPLATFVESVNNANVLLSQAFTLAGSGTYRFDNPGGTGVYMVDKSQTAGSGGSPISNVRGYYRVQSIESFIAPANSSGRAALGDRIEKSFYLGGNQDAAEYEKAVFVFGVKALGPIDPANPPTLFFTKYWKEIR